MNTWRCIHAVYIHVALHSTDMHSPGDSVFVAENHLTLYMLLCSINCSCRPGFDVQVTDTYTSLAVSCTCRVSTWHWRPSGQTHLGAKAPCCPRKRKETPLQLGPTLAIGVQTCHHCLVIVKLSKEGRLSHTCHGIQVNANSLSCKRQIIAVAVCIWSGHVETCFTVLHEHHDSGTYEKAAFTQVLWYLPEPMLAVGCAPFTCISCKFHPMYY